MSITLAVTLAMLAKIEPACSWDRPGVNRYRGTISAALERYTDIPAQVRSTLLRRMQEKQSDDLVAISRDTISGRYRYEAEIRDMHFGAASLCRSVSRTGWSASHRETAQVYCVGAYCILLPKICGNVSRVQRIETAASAHAAYSGAPAGKPRNSSASTEPARRPREQASTADAPAALRRQLMARQAPLAAPAIAIPLFEFPEPVVGSVSTDWQDVGTSDDDEGSDRFAGRTSPPIDRPDSTWPAPFPDRGADDTIIPLPVPEPGNATMLSTGLGLLFWIRQRRSRRRTTAVLHFQPQTRRHQAL